MSTGPARSLPVTFSTFLVSLASSAMAHLGLTDEPGSKGPRVVDLELARQTIDLLGVLEQKTKGNLDEDEARLLETLLTELRVQFVTVKRQQAT